MLAGCVAAPQANQEEALLSDPASLSPVDLTPGEKLSVVATTSIVADVVGNVGGDSIDLTALVPPGVDPHAFEPTPQDLGRAADADVIFLNGFGLDSRLAEVLIAAAIDAPVVSLSEGITPLTLEEEHADGGETGGIDPHTWLDPVNVIVWAENCAQALAALDPDRAGDYTERAANYTGRLQALDAEIRSDLQAISPQDRRLVTDHDEFGYFANRYGFTILGAVIPGFSTGSEPSPQQLASLEQAILDLHVRALFVSSVVTPTLAERVAQDTGVRLVTLYAHSLSAPDGPAPTYLDLMRYNVEAIVDALAP
jgi:ABC-type Zn uptake system ZnuABC Zn-binding protein ZnuA